MKIHINRNASVKDFYVKMEYGVQKNRGDIIAYTKLAQENGNILSAKELNKKLLGKPNTRIAEFLLDYCVKQNLFKRMDNGDSVELTSYGNNCAKEQIFYEKGSDIFHVQYLDEEHSKNPLVSCERLSSRDKQLPENVEIIPTPSILKNSLENAIIDLNLEDKRKTNEELLTETILVYGLGEKCVELPSVQDVSVTGIISENSPLQEWVTTHESLCWSRSDIEFSALLEDILGNPDIELHWNKKYDRLITQFPSPSHIQLSDAGISGEVTLNNLQLKHYAPEQKVDIKLKGCPLMPASADDAKNWYYWLIEESIRDYLSESDYRDLVEEKLGLFEDFSEFIGSFEQPQRMEFAAHVREINGERNALYWHIMAPLDLSLEGIL